MKSLGILGFFAIQFAVVLYEWLQWQLPWQQTKTTNSFTIKNDAHATKSIDIAGDRV
jgi:hypothetical protein